MSSNVVVRTQQSTTTSCYNSVLEALISASSNSVVGIQHINYMRSNQCLLKHTIHTTGKALLQVIIIDSIEALISPNKRLLVRLLILL